MAAGDHWLKMDGREVFRRAVRVIVDSARLTLDHGLAGVLAAGLHPLCEDPAVDRPTR